MTQQKQQKWREYPAAFTYVFFDWYYYYYYFYYWPSYLYRHLVSIRPLSLSLSLFCGSFSWMALYIFRYQIIFVLFIAVLIFAVIWDVLWQTSCCCVYTFWILKISSGVTIVTYRCFFFDNSGPKFRNTKMLHSWQAMWLYVIIIYTVLLNHTTTKCSILLIRSQWLCMRLEFMCLFIFIK